MSPSEKASRLLIALRRKQSKTLKEIIKLVNKQRAKRRYVPTHVMFIASVAETIIQERKFRS